MDEAEINALVELSLKGCARYEGRLAELDSLDFFEKKRSKFAFTHLYPVFVDLVKNLAVAAFTKEGNLTYREVWQVVEAKISKWSGSIAIAKKFIDWRQKNKVEAGVKHHKAEVAMEAKARAALEEAAERHSEVADMSDKKVTTQLRSARLQPDTAEKQKAQLEAHLGEQAQEAGLAHAEALMRVHEAEEAAAEAAEESPEIPTNEEEFLALIALYAGDTPIIADNNFIDGFNFPPWMNEFPCTNILRLYALMKRNSEFQEKIRQQAQELEQFMSRDNDNFEERWDGALQGLLQEHAVVEMAGKAAAEPEAEAEAEPEAEAEDAPRAETAEAAEAAQAAEAEPETREADPDTPSVEVETAGADPRTSQSKGTIAEQPKGGGARKKNKSKKKRKRKRTTKAKRKSRGHKSRKQRTQRKPIKRTIKR